MTDVTTTETITITEPDGTTVEVSGPRGPQGIQGPPGEDGAAAAGALLAASNLSDLASASTARTNLGLGTAATKDVGTGSTNVSAGDHTHAIDGLLPSQTGNSGKVLQTNGSAASWATASGGSSNPEDESTVIASRLFG